MLRDRPEANSLLASVTSGVGLTVREPWRRRDRGGNAEDRQLTVAELDSGKRVSAGRMARAAAYLPAAVALVIILVAGLFAERQSARSPGSTSGGCSGASCRSAPPGSRPRSWPQVSDADRLAGALAAAPPPDPGRLRGAGRPARADDRPRSRSSPRSRRTALRWSSLPAAGTGFTADLARRLDAGRPAPA